MSSQAFGAALARATLMFDDVGRSVAGARRAVELAGDQPAENAWAGSALGQALYLSGQAAEARAWLEDLVSQVPASVQPMPWSPPWRCCAARRRPGRPSPPPRWPVGRWQPPRHTGSASSRSVGSSTWPWDGPWPATGARRGRGPAGAGAGAVRDRQHGPAPHLGPVGARVGAARSGRPARRSGAGRPGPRAGRPVDRSWHAPGCWSRPRKRLDSRPRRPVQLAAPLTERELAVLRLLPHRLSTREIGRELCLTQHREKPYPGHLPQAPGQQPGRGGHHCPSARPASSGMILDASPTYSAPLAQALSEAGFEQAVVAVAWQSAAITR